MQGSQKVPRVIQLSPQKWGPPHPIPIPPPWLFILLSCPGKDCGVHKVDFGICLEALVARRRLPL